MLSRRLQELALDRYAASLRGNTASPYECLRFFEHAFRYRQEDGEELQRRATMQLARHDPLLLATSVHGQLVTGLTDTDIESCIGAWSIDDPLLAALLEGHFWMAAAGRHAPFLPRVERALAALERAAPGFGDDRFFLKLYCDALGTLDDARYPAALDALLDRTPAEWHSHPLQDAMRHAVEREDWSRYDALRSRWGTMPRNSHICECATNYVANIDGLRALDRGDADGAVRLLQESVVVNGCPHLNTGCASLRLANALLDRDLAVSDVEQHLRTVEQYATTKRTAELRQRLAERGNGESPTR